jgi:hypothetical protein
VQYRGKVKHSEQPEDYNMSMYAQAVSQGVQAASLAAGVQSAETVAAYNAEYSTISSKLAASRQRSAAERNISAVNMDKITSNTKIAQQQDEAEAQARLSAALSGSKGASVDATIAQTEVTAAGARKASEKAANQQIEDLKAGIYGSSMKLQAQVEVPKTTLAGSAINALTSFEMSDLKIMESFENEPAKDVGTLEI